VTELGLDALKRYRAIQDLAWDAVRHPVREFQRLLGPLSEPEVPSK
jgi:hypothetical protein